MSAIIARLGQFGGGFTGAPLRLRLRAAMIHLLLSALISGVLSVSLVLLLYPMPYFHAAGGKSILLVILLVDIVLGPLLTFLVFDRRKASLRRDLATIGAVQIIALAYGLYATAMSRPVFQTFVRDRFELVSAAEIDPQELQKALPQFRRFAWGAPQLAAARQPDDPKERELMMFSAAYGIDARHLLRHYVDYSQLREQVIAKSRPISELDRYNDPARVAAVLAAELPEHGGADQLRYLPLTAKREDLSAIIDRDSARVIAVVRLKPW